MSTETSERQGVKVGKWHSGLGNETCRVEVGDQVMRLVKLDWPGTGVEPLFMVEDWETFERIPQAERSGKPGSWRTERAAMARLIEHVYEHSAMSSDAHKAAARWLMATDWGRRAA